MIADILFMTLFINLWAVADYKAVNLYNPKGERVERVLGGILEKDRMDNLMVCFNKAKRAGKGYYCE